MFPYSERDAIQARVEKAKKVALEIEKLEKEYNELMYKARRNAGDAFDRGGWNNEELPICKFTNAMVDASVAKMRLLIATGEINIPGK